MVRRPRGLAVVVLGGALAASCGSDAAAPTPVTPPPTTAAPAPTPAPGFVCPLPKGTGSGTNCTKPGSRLGDIVPNAVHGAIAAHPELFDLNDMAGGNPRVKDHDKYVQAVLDEIHKQGVCAKDDNEEIAVKNSNDFSEQWNIYYSEGYTRFSYITTCIPAWF